MGVGGRGRIFGKKSDAKTESILVGKVDFITEGMEKIVLDSSKVGGLSLAHFIPLS